MRDAEIAVRVTSTIKVHLIGDTINFIVVQHRQFYAIVVYFRNPYCFRKLHKIVKFARRNAGNQFSIKRILGKVFRFVYNPARSQVSSRTINSFDLFIFEDMRESLIIYENSYLARWSMSYVFNESTSIGSSSSSLFGIGLAVLMIKKL